MKFIFLFLLIFLLSCNNFSKDKIKKGNQNQQTDKTLRRHNILADTIMENKIYDTLFKLSFIKRNSDYIDSVTNHQHGIAFLMYPPSKDDTDIFVQAGYNGKERFETHFQIYVNTKTMTIKVYEPINDKKLSIKEFEKYLDSLR